MEKVLLQVFLTIIQPYDRIEGGLYPHNLTKKKDGPLFELD